MAEDNLEINPPGRTLPHAQALEMDRLCSEFERQLRAGEQPLLANLLSLVPADSRELLLPRLLAVDIHVRRARGETPQASDYAELCSDRPEVLARILDGASNDFASNVRSTKSLKTHSFDTYSFRPPAGSTAEEGTIPTAIGRYVVERLLGRGGFGQVLLAWDDDLQRRVAIKMPRADRIYSSEQVELYISEARSVARLDHPSIVPVYDVGRTDDGQLYVVSKFIEGSDLER